jgi:membrane associated rhomboid family serine protease
MNILEDLKLQYKVGGITNKLIYWNVGLFVIPYVLFSLLALFNIDVNFLNFISLSSNPSDLLWKPWSIITYAFFHAGFMHLFFNMMVLNFASRLFVIYFNPKQLLSLYFSGIIFAGIVYILSFYSLPFLSNVNTGLIGASGAIMAVLFAVVTYSPLMEVRLMLVGTLKLWHIALFLIVADLIQLPLENTGGHLAHLGGAFFGYFYIKQLQNGTDLGLWFTKLMDGLTNLFSKRNSTPFVKVHKNYNTTTMPRRESRIVPKDKTQQQIDEILDKISQSGYDSLTKEEKDFLFRAGK